MDYKQRDYVTCTILFDNDIKKECILINHHMAHAASVFYTSNLEKSAIFSVDASGLEGPNSSGYFLGDGNSIQYIGTPGLMIGSLYNAMTEILSYG